MTNKVIKIFGLMLLGVFLMSCVAVDPYTGKEVVSKTTIGTGVGAAGGAIIGGLTGGSRGALVGAALGAGSGAVIGHSMDRQDAELRQILVGTGVQIHKVGDRVQLLMASDVTFATDSADIRSSFYHTLNSVALVLKKYANTSITINGYTDNTGNYLHNQELSERRAASVGAYLESQRINPNRIFTKGFGSRHPIASNSNSEGRALNRRVVITLRPLN